MRTTTRSLLTLGGLLTALLAQPGLAETVSFADAAARVRAKAPETGAAAARLEGARQVERRAGILPDPSLDIELENIGGRGTGSAFDRSEVTVAARQPLEFGPRLAARRAQASAATRLAEAEAGADGRRLVAELAVRYATADAAGRRLVLAREQAELAAQRRLDSARRLAAGLVPELETQRITVAEAQAMAVLATAEAEARRSGAALSRLLGMPAAEPESGWLESLAVADTPRAKGSAADAGLWNARSESAEASARAAVAAGKPSADLRIGVRRDYGVDTTSGVAGVGLGLPLWNGNKAAIAHARAEAQAARFEAERAARDSIDTREASAGRIAAETARLSAIRSAALPAAKRAMELTERGWRAGALAWRDVADATEGLFETRASEIAALEGIAVARAQFWLTTEDPAVLGLRP